MRIRIAAFCAVALVIAGCSGQASNPQTGNPKPSPSVETCNQFTQNSLDATGNDALPAVTVECLQGFEKIRLSQLRGPMLMPVWASWCQPCSEEMPVMQQFADQYGDRVPVLGYALLDETRQAIAGSVNWGVTLPSLEDPDGEYRAQLQVTAPPTTLFINSQGQVVYRKIGAVINLDELKVLVATYLKVQL